MFGVSRNGTVSGMSNDFPYCDARGEFHDTSTDGVTDPLEETVEVAMNRVTRTIIHHDILAMPVSKPECQVRSMSRA